MVSYRWCEESDKVWRDDAADRGDRVGYAEEHAGEGTSYVAEVDVKATAIVEGTLMVTMATVNEMN